MTGADPLQMKERLRELIAAARQDGLAHPQVSEHDIAMRQAQHWTAGDRAGLAVLFMTQEVWNARRQRQLEIEREAAREAQSEATDRWIEQARRERREREQRSEAEQKERAARDRERMEKYWREEREREQQRVKAASESFPELFQALRDDPASLYRIAVRMRHVKEDTARLRLVQAVEQVDEQYRPYRVAELAAYDAKYPRGRCRHAYGGSQCRKEPEGKSQFCAKHQNRVRRVEETRPSLPPMPERRERFAAWLGGEDAYDKWVAGAMSVMHGLGTHWGYTFADDWYTGGYTRWAVDGLIATIADRTRLEVTAELLGSQFALGDGRRVTWGEATRADHEQRAEMQATYAAADMQDAARHRAAIAMLDEHGVATLGDVLALQQN